MYCLAHEVLFFYTDHISTSDWTHEVLFLYTEHILNSRLDLHVRTFTILMLRNLYCLTLFSIIPLELMSHSDLQMTTAFLSVQFEAPIKPGSQEHGVQVACTPPADIAVKVLSARADSGGYIAFTLLNVILILFSWLALMNILLWRCVHSCGQDMQLLLSVNDHILFSYVCSVQAVSCQNWWS